MTLEHPVGDLGEPDRAVEHPCSGGVKSRLTAAFVVAKVLVMPSAS